MCVFSEVGDMIFFGQFSSRMNIDFDHNQKFKSCLGFATSSTSSLSAPSTSIPCNFTSVELKLR